MDALIMELCDIGHHRSLSTPACPIIHSSYDSSVRHQLRRETSDIQIEQSFYILSSENDVNIIVIIIIIHTHMYNISIYYIDIIMLIINKGCFQITLITLITCAITLVHPGMPC